MILVTGATGNVGSEAARLLAARHQPTRALVRDPARAPHGDIEIATGDFDRPDTLDAAMRGIDTVLLVSPAVPAQEIAVFGSAAGAASPTTPGGMAIIYKDLIASDERGKNSKVACPCPTRTTGTCSRRRSGEARRPSSPPTRRTSPPPHSHRSGWRQSTPTTSSTPVRSG